VEEIKNIKAARKGDALHYLFSQLKAVPGKDLRAEIAPAAEKTGRFFPSFSALEMEEAAIRIVSHPQYAEFFRPREAEVYTEKELVDLSGNTRRIDRLVIGAKEAWVIDYKSSRQGYTGHLRQIKEYAALAKGAYPGLRVKGFLLYLDASGVEQVYG
jgi:ATP-dependent exoDNAse (exonuclease V) beta subunit